MHATRGVLTFSALLQESFVEGHLPPVPRLLGHPNLGRGFCMLVQALVRKMPLNIEVTFSTNLDFGTTLGATYN